MIHQRSNYTFAVLVDGENISQKYLGAILREVEKAGTVALTRVYADWTNPTREGWKQTLHEHGARPVQQFNYGKDAADHALIMDAIELSVSNPRLNAICIVSFDGGFHTVALRIREKGLYVMGVGQRKTPERFRKACHNFVYTDLLESPTAATGSVGNEEKSLDQLLTEAFYLASPEGDPIVLGQFGKHLKMLDPAFDPRSYSFKTLKELIKANPVLFAVVKEATYGMEIILKPALQADKKELRLEGVVSKWVTYYGFIESKAGSFYFHQLNVPEKHRMRRIKTGEKVRFTVAKAPDNTAEHSSDKNGKAKDIEFID